MPGSKHSETGSSGGGLQRWWQDHSELDQLVGKLQDATERQSVAAASAALEELAEALEGHFTVEEEVYFPLVERLRPELAETMKDARMAHLTLRGQLDQLRGLLSDGDREAARGVLGALLELFRRHEALEERLIADLSSLASA